MAADNPRRERQAERDRLYQHPSRLEKGLKEDDQTLRFLLLDSFDTILNISQLQEFIYF